MFSCDSIGVFNSKNNERYNEAKKIILTNKDLFAYHLFYKKGFFHSLYVKLELLCLKNKGEKEFEDMLLLGFITQSNSNIPLPFLKVISQVFPKQLTKDLVLTNKNITFASLGFNHINLASLYTHYILNKQKILNFSSEEEKEDLKIEQLSTLIDKIYNND